MPEAPGDRELLERWRAGDQDAARQIFERYADRLIALADRRLSERLSSRIDPEDIVQSAFRTFFVRVRKGRFTLPDDDALCKLLMRITVHKTLQQVAYQKAAKRDPSREAEQAREPERRMQELMAKEPTDEVVTGFLDQLEGFLNELGDRGRRIIELRMHNYTNEEIAKKLDISDRTVRRVIERVKGLGKSVGLKG
jgi:RNA polymerase sigma-70 factor (ECF subfamily)